MIEPTEPLEPLCACGEPLHYADPAIRLALFTLISEMGPTVRVTTPSGSWMVPRHYIALHGLAAAELPELAERYGFERE